MIPNGQTPLLCQTTDPVYGSICRVSCDIGYLLIGTQSIFECDATGNWKPALNEISCMGML